MSRFAPLLLLCVTTLLVGCASRPAAGLYNNTGRRIIGAVQQGQTLIVHRSLLSPGEWKVNSPWPTEVGERATVSWQEEEQQYSREVAIGNAVSNSFNGTVWFKVEPDRSVLVIPVTRNDANQGTAGPDRWKRESRR